MLLCCHVVVHNAQKLTWHFYVTKISEPYISAAIVASTSEIYTSVILVLVMEKMVDIMFT